MAPTSRMMSGLHARSAAASVEDNLFMAGGYMGARGPRQPPPARMVLLRLQAQDIGDDFVLLLAGQHDVGHLLVGCGEEGVQAGLRRRRILGDGIPAWGRVRRGLRLS